MNALQELNNILENINKTIDDIELIYIVFHVDNKGVMYITSVNEIEKLDAEYDDGFGMQNLFGYIVFKDATWLERSEYDGSEWWEYKNVNEIRDKIKAEILRLKTFRNPEEQSK